MAKPATPLEPVPLGPIPPGPSPGPEPIPSGPVPLDPATQKNVELTLRADRNQLYTAWQAIAKLAGSRRNRVGEHKSRIRKRLRPEQTTERSAGASGGDGSDQIKRQ